MLDMMKKLQEAQRQMKEIKSRLDSVTVTGASNDRSIVVRANGNRKILGIEFASDAPVENIEQLKADIIAATNNALEASEKVNESEMKSAAGSMMPGMSGLFK